MNSFIDLNRNDLADGLDFDMNLKTISTDMIQMVIQTDLIFIAEFDLEIVPANKRLID